VQILLLLTTLNFKKHISAEKVTHKCRKGYYQSKPECHQIFTCDST